MMMKTFLPLLTVPCAIALSVTPVKVSNDGTAKSGKKPSGQQEVATSQNGNAFSSYCTRECNSREAQDEEADPRKCFKLCQIFLSEPQSSEGQDSTEADNGIFWGSSCEEKCAKAWDWGVLDSRDSCDKMLRTLLLC